MRCSLPISRVARRLSQWVSAWTLMMLLALAGSLGWAQGLPLPAAVMLSDAASSVPLANRSQYLLDAGGILGVADVESRLAQLPFANRPEDHTLLLSGGDALWIRFVARVNGREDRWLLQVDLLLIGVCMKLCTQNVIWILRLQTLMAMKKVIY